MSESNVAVKISADVTDLNAKIALAQANLRSFNSETRNLANQVRDASDAERSQLIPQLEASASAAAKAKTELVALNDNMMKGAAAASSFRERLALTGKSLDDLNLRVADYTSLASKFGELLLVTFGGERLLDGINKTAALGEQLLKLSQTTGVSTTKLSDWHYAAGQLGIDTASLDTALVRLGKSMQQAIENRASAAAQSFNLMGISQQYLTAHSNDLEVVLRKMADAFHTHAAGAQAAAIAENVMGRSAADLVPFLQLGSSGLDRAAKAAHDLGAEIGPDAAEKMEVYEQAVKKLSVAWEGFWITITTKVAPALTKFADILTDTLSPSVLNNNLPALKAQAQEWEAQVERIGQKMAAENPLFRFIDNIHLNAAKASLAQVEQQLNRLNAEAAAKNNDAGKTIPIPGATSTTGAPASDSTLPQFGNLISSTNYEEFRQRVAEMEATWKGSTASMYAEAVKMWQGEVATARLSATQMIEARIAMATLQREEMRAEQADEKKAAAQRLAMNREEANTKLQIGKIKLQSERDELQAEVDAGKITESQKVADLRDLAQKEYQLDLQNLQNELATLQQGTIAYQRAYDQILILKQRFNAQMSQLEQQAAAAQKKDLDKATKEWEQSFQPITRAFDTTVTGMIMGTQTWQQAVVRLGQSVVASFIDDGVKMLTHWIAKELAQTEVTQAGVAARSAAESTSATDFVGRIGTMVAEWLGFETQKTTATVAGEAAGRAASVMAGFSQISVDAAVAAAGAMAATAAIPFVGPELAPAAAAAAYAETMGWAAGLGGGVASAAGGMWDVPSTMLSIIHPEESIVPASVANPMRDFFEGGAQGGGGVDVHFHITAMDGQSVANVLKANGKTIAAVIAAEIQNGNGALRRSLNS